MKKNIILGIGAFVFAVSSAFAAMAPATAWVLAKTSPSSSFVCRAVSAICDNIGSATCLVEVNVTISGGTEIVTGRRGTTCSPTLTNSSQAPIPVLDSFYDVQ